MSNCASTNRSRPRIAITTGEPAGIGPDLVSGLGGRAFAAELIAIGNVALLNDRAARLGRGSPFVVYESGSQSSAPPGGIPTIDVPIPCPVRPGVLEVGNAGYVLATIERAAAGCLNGEFDAMVTAPVQKSLINDAGHRFTGHTEYLAELAGGARPVMLLVAGELRVALATTHLPLRQVADALTAEQIEYVVKTVAQAMRRSFGFEAPTIGVCGLNPHAGEAGHLGREELEVITPALDRCRRDGWNVQGPLPADTAFTPAARARYTAYVSMFHDQGLPVLKALGFGHAVNVTLGLPFIRTSVDHGTALELAGSAEADPGSLLAAVELAIHLGGHA